MNCMRNAANMSRTARICTRHGGSIFLILLLATTQIACRPSDETDETVPMDYADYAGVDNIEWHNVKIVDGVVQEDHPVIMYKEDFVNENFKPRTRHSAKKYKDIAAVRQEKQQQVAANVDADKTVESEKIYFDVLPEAPIVEENSKFDPTQITATNLLSNSTASTEDDQSKQQLRKRPKKYHHRRVRRQADTTEHNVRKRNPYYRTVYYYSVNNAVPQPIVPQQVSHVAQVFLRHPVQGKREPTKQSQGNKVSPDMPMSIGTRINDVITFPDDDNVDRSVFGGASNAAPTTRRPTLSLWHDSDPNNADFSVFDRTTTPPPESARVPTARPMRPNNQAARRPSPPTTTRAPATTAASGIPPCVWAIVNCCSSSIRVRYQCFEQLNCIGAFWDINPCAEAVRQRAISYVSDYYDPL